MVNFILYFINYKSISSLNIDYLVLVFYLSSLISSIIGLYYVFYKFEFKLDLNKTLSLTGKICLFTVIVIYLSLFIGVISGYLINFLENNFLFKKILCESSDDVQNILNNIKDSTQGKISDDSRIDLSNASNISNTANTKSISGNNSQIILGDGSTLSNNTIQTPENSSNITTTLKRSREYVKSNGKNNGFVKVTDEVTTTFNKK